MPFVQLFVALVLGAEPVPTLPVELTTPDGQRASAAFNAHLLRESLKLVERRRAAYELMKTAEDARAWQTARRKFFIDQIGGIPAPARPSSRTIGTIDGGDYTMEKVIYESRPGHHVTAVLYLPKHSMPPYAAMVICCGHSYDGKASEGYQRVGILAAKNGLAALCFDPIGQGERYQVLRVAGRPGHHTAARPNPRMVAVQDLTPSAPPQYNPVEEHTLIGIGPILLGTNTAHYRIWDAMRSVDYLLTRPDIDPKRIGATGNSGGGTESSYLMALDDRIAAAAPGCFLTSYRRLLETVGPQDAEQNIFGQLAFGLDEADYVTMTAPRPVCILAATRDATFDINGTWDVFREGKRFYNRLGHPQRVDLVETDDVHGFTIHLREGAVRWMRRWLLGIDDAVVERDFPIHAPLELQCTPQGQVLLMEGERSVFALSADHADRLAVERRSRLASLSSEKVRQRIAGLIGIDLDEAPRVEAQIAAKDPPAALAGSKWLIRLGRVPLCVRIEQPRTPVGELVLYATAEGVAGTDRTAEPVKSWLQEGKAVAVIDLSGLGVTQPAGGRQWGGELFGPSVPEFFMAYLNGRSIVGMRTEDLLAASDYLARHLKIDKLHLHGVGVAAIPALHAAALSPERFVTTTVEQAITTWNEVVRTPVPENQLINTVHGALTVYDLPDLVDLAGGSKRVKLLQPVDAQGRARELSQKPDSR